MGRFRGRGKGGPWLLPWYGTVRQGVRAAMHEAGEET